MYFTYAHVIAYSTSSLFRVSIQTFSMRENYIFKKKNHARGEHELTTNRAINHWKSQTNNGTHDIAKVCTKVYWHPLLMKGLTTLVISMSTNLNV